MKHTVITEPADGELPATQAAHRRALWTLIAVATVLRLVLAGTLGAAIDEPYYIEFVRHPAASYFDHPPMVALVGALGLSALGNAFSVFGLRLGFIALFVGSTWLMARITTRYFGARAGFLAALVLSASGYFGVAVGTIAQPDGPLLFFWLLTIDRLAVALDDPAQRVRPWLGVGLAWGGAMLSKYHAVLLPVGALLYLVLRPEARRVLRRPGPYVASAIGVLMFSPVLFWNATHEWASFLFQGGRASASDWIRPDQLIAAIGGELLYLFPWLWIDLVVILAVLLRRRPRQWSGSEAFLFSQSAPALVLFHVIAARGRIMAYWPLFGFITLMPLAGREWARRLEAGARGTRRWLLAIAVFPIVLATLTVLQARFALFNDREGRLLGVIPARYDPTLSLICWDQVAAELARRGLLGSPETFLFSDSWERSANLALATRGRAPVACYHLEPRSYGYWSKPEDWLGRDGIFVEPVRVPGALSNYRRFFARYELMARVPIVRGGVVVHEVYLHRGTHQTRPFPFDGRFKERIAVSAQNRSRY